MKLALSQCMPLNFFNYGEAFTGSLKGLRYHIIKQQAEDTAFLAVTIWQGPYSLARTPSDKRIQQSFLFDEEGRKSAVDFINEEFEAHPELYREEISILDR